MAHLFKNGFHFYFIIFTERISMSDFLKTKKKNYRDQQSSLPPQNSWNPQGSVDC